MDKKTKISKTHNKKDGISGKLYCIYNEVHKFYGENIYKLGNSKDVVKRLNGYTTAYIKPCEIKLVSEVFRNKNLAEKILFSMLKEYRISGAREFFKCDIEIIKEKIKEIEELFKKYNNDIDLENKFSNNYMTKIQIKEKNITFTQKIFNANNIDNTTYIKITNKFKNKNASKDEEYCYYKYGIKNYWKLKIITIEILEKYLQTEIILNRLLYLYDKQLVGSKYCEDKINEKTNVIKEIINILGFDLYNLEIILNRETYYDNVNKLLNNNEFAKNFNKNRKIFGMTRAKLNKNLKGSGLSICLNNFLKKFGLQIICKINKITITKNKRKNIFKFLLIIIDKYNNVIKTNSNNNLIKEIENELIDNSNEISSIMSDNNSDKKNVQYDSSGESDQENTKNNLQSNSNNEHEENINGKVYKVAKLIKKIKG